MKCRTINQVMEDGAKTPDYMAKKYRLEFSDKYQVFHLDHNGSHTENTNKWVTISDKCSDLEFHIFESYVSSVKKGRLTKSFLLECKANLTKFTEILKEYNLTITNNK
jgi:hypothetical protein